MHSVETNIFLLAIIPVLGLLAANAALTELVHPGITVEVLGVNMALLYGLTDLRLQIGVVARLACQRRIPVKKVNKEGMQADPISS